MNNSRYTNAAFIAAALMSAAILIPAGCGKSQSALPPIDYYLVITDSIGVESGDSNYVLVWPSDVACSPSGEIAVLDMMKDKVFFYSPQGEFLRSVGQEGEGPGRLSTPYRFRFFADGSFLVQGGNGISLFDSTGAFERRMRWPRYTPSLIAALDDGSFIGEGTVMEGDAQGITCTTTICRWEGEGAPVVEYYTNEFEFPLPDDYGVMDMARHRDVHIASCASGDGRVFYTTNSVDNFEITGFDPDGTMFFHVVDEDYRT